MGRSDCALPGNPPSKQPPLNYKPGNQDRDKKDEHGDGDNGAGLRIRFRRYAVTPRDGQAGQGEADDKAARIPDENGGRIEIEDQKT